MPWIRLILQQRVGPEQRTAGANSRRSVSRMALRYGSSGLGGKFGQETDELGRLPKFPNLTTIAEDPVNLRAIRRSHRSRLWRHVKEFRGPKWDTVETSYGFCLCSIPRSNRPCLTPVQAKTKASTGWCRREKHLVDADHWIRCVGTGRPGRKLCRETTL